MITRLSTTGAALLAWMMSGAPALAEWVGEPGAARDPERTLALTCGTGTAPFVATLEIAGRLVPPTDSDRRVFTLYLDDQGYRFAPAFFDPAQDNWLMPVSMSDPFTIGLFRTERLIVDAGGGQAWEYRTEGMAQALSEAFGACVDGWRDAGYAVPAALAALGSGTARVPSGPPATIAAHISRGCAGGYTMDPSELLSGLIDSDGAPDYVLDWNIVRCTAGLARPFCGAANCSIDVFLSSRGYALREGDGFLGIAPQLVPLSNGRMGLKISGTAGACATGFCDRPFWWDGVKLRQ